MLRDSFAGDRLRSIIISLLAFESVCLFIYLFFFFGRAQKTIFDFFSNEKEKYFIVCFDDFTDLFGIYFLLLLKLTVFFLRLLLVYVSELIICLTLVRFFFYMWKQ